MQRRVPENKVKVAPYFERTVRPLIQGADLIMTSADEEDEEVGK